MKGKGLKLKGSSFRGDIGTKFLPERVVRLCGSCGWPIPGMSKARLDGIGAMWCSGRALELDDLPVPLQANASRGSVSSRLPLGTFLALQGPAGLGGRALTWL